MKFTNVNVHRLLMPIRVKRRRRSTNVSIAENAAIGLDQEKLAGPMSANAEPVHLVGIARESWTGAEREFE